MPDEQNSEPALDPREIYPNAQPLFGFQLEPLSRIKDTALVVIDTNALLVPYQVGTKSLAEIEKTYQRLAQQHRLVIPGQVAREFAKHRATKIGELHQQLINQRDRTPHARPR